MPQDDMTCKCCLSEQEARGEQPRKLVALPQGGKEKNTKMYVCPHCDGPVLELATREAS